MQRNRNYGRAFRTVRPQDIGDSLLDCERPRCGPGAGGSGARGWQLQKLVVGGPGPGSRFDQLSDANFTILMQDSG